MDNSYNELSERLTALVALVKPDKNGRLKLPPERTLVDHFKVPRFEIRNSLATLEHLGFLKRLRGSGTFLQMPEPGFVQLYFEMALCLGYVTEASLTRAREMLEFGIVQTAAENVFDGDIAELRKLCGLIMESDPDKSLEADRAFHEKLAMMTRNPVIVLISKCLASVLNKILYQRRVIVRHSPRASALTNGTHVAIVDAVEQKNPQAAYAAMVNHFRVWDEQYFLVTAPRPA
jgi:DNA-binding FadR family transcriptional regulator